MNTESMSMADLRSLNKRGLLSDDELGEVEIVREDEQADIMENEREMFSVGGHPHRDEITPPQVMY